MKKFIVMALFAAFLLSCKKETDKVITPPKWLIGKWQSLSYIENRVDIISNTNTFIEIKENDIIIIKNSNKEVFSEKSNMSFVQAKDEWKYIFKYVCKTNEESKKIDFRKNPKREDECYFLDTNETAYHLKKIKNK